MSRVPSPQRDKRPGLSGGADIWDNDTAGKILLDDYMHGAPPVVETLYKGANWGGYRVGPAPDATLYLGTLTLHS